MKVFVENLTLENKKLMIYVMKITFLVDCIFKNKLEKQVKPIFFYCENVKHKEKLKVNIHIFLDWEGCVLWDL